MISVIIPAYNSADTIVRALDSVKNQSYKGVIEIIVVNDGSRDNTKDIVNDYRRDNPGISLTLLDQKNGGVSRARNAGLKVAKGDYIAFLDADDIWVNSKLEIQMKYFNNEVDFICALRNKDTIGFPYIIKNNAAEIRLKKLLFKVVGQTSTAIFKRKVLENTGYFDETQRYSEDANYWMRISLSNKMIILNQRLVFTENDYGQNGISANIVEMEHGVQKNIYEMFKLKKINFIEYQFFKLFAKLKYIRRKNMRTNA